MRMTEDRQCHVYVWQCRYFMNNPHHVVLEKEISKMVTKYP